MKEIVKQCEGVPWRQTEMSHAEEFYWWDNFDVWRVEGERFWRWFKHRRWWMADVNDHGKAKTFEAAVRMALEADGRL